MLLHSASDLWRIVIIGVRTYLALIAILRLFGKRTLAKMNAFDLIAPSRSAPPWRPSCCPATSPCSKGSPP